MATGGGGLGHRDPLYRRLGLGGSGNKPKGVVLLPHRFHITINIISFLLRNLGRWGRWGTQQPPWWQWQWLFGLIIIRLCRCCWLLNNNNKCSSNNNNTTTTTKYNYYCYYYYSYYYDNNNRYYYYYCYYCYYCYYYYYYYSNKNWLLNSSSNKYNYYCYYYYSYYFTRTDDNARTRDLRYVGNDALYRNNQLTIYMQMILTCDSFWCWLV